MFYKNEIKAFERPKLFHVLPRRPKKIEIIVRARPGLQTTAVSPFMCQEAEFAFPFVVQAAATSALFIHFV